MTCTLQAKLRRRLREVCNHLALPRDSTEQALHLLGRAAPVVMAPASHWRREHLVAAAAYASARLDRRPLTLVDLSGVMQARQRGPWVAVEGGLLLAAAGLLPGQGVRGEQAGRGRQDGPAADAQPTLCPTAD